VDYGVVMMVMLLHRATINVPTKRGKEKSPSDGHCQCEKELDDHILATQQFLKESHVVNRLIMSEINDESHIVNRLILSEINDISFFWNV
jgi:hypothetical protein